MSNNYITRVKTESQSVGEQISWRQDAVEKTGTQKGWARMPPVKQPKRTGKNAVMAIRAGVNMLQICSASNSPHTQ